MNQALISIGALANATGLSVDTIRVWERRYGEPKPIRLPSGHRRYSQDHVVQLRRVAEALALGMRPGKVFALDAEELSGILENKASATKTSDPQFERELKLVLEYDRVSLWRCLNTSRSQTSARDFILNTVAPLLNLVGREWAEGRVDVRHEHFLTEVLNDFLRSMRKSLVANYSGRVLMATLSGEQHGLGLQMASIFACLAGVEPVILGTELPLEEILPAVEESQPDGVAISVSLSSGGTDADREIAELRRLLPAEVFLVVGGGGARGVRRGPRNVHYASGLPEFESLLGDLMTSV